MQGVAVAWGRAFDLPDVAADLEPQLAASVAVQEQFRLRDEVPGKALVSGVVQIDWRHAAMEHVRYVHPGHPANWAIAAPCGALALWFTIDIAFIENSPAAGRSGGRDGADPRDRRGPATPRALPGAPDLPPAFRFGVQPDRPTRRGATLCHRAVQA